MKVSTKPSETAADVSVQRMARYLEELFGQKLTALIVGIAEPREIGRWARGEAEPEIPLVDHLSAAYQIATRLRRVESASAVRAWFVGMNPDLDDRAPAELVAQHPALVQEAADIFIAAG